MLHVAKGGVAEAERCKALRKPKANKMRQNVQRAHKRLHKLHAKQIVACGLPQRGQGNGGAGQVECQSYTIWQIIIELASSMVGRLKIYAPAR